ncbi:hypothetical protein HDU79_010959 [Rhizoclosmatium sp. JEL0117]|nr:hypothetical protein HDU79_010959 [Rhizoclosmatium sp. JEL0117]
MSSSTPRESTQQQENESIQKPTSATLSSHTPQNHSKPATPQTHPTSPILLPTTINTIKPSHHLSFIHITNGPNPPSLAGAISLNETTFRNAIASHASGHHPLHHVKKPESTTHDSSEIEDASHGRGLGKSLSVVVKGTHYGETISDPRKSVSAGAVTRAVFVQEAVERVDLVGDGIQVVDEVTAGETGTEIKVSQILVGEGSETVVVTGHQADESSVAIDTAENTTAPVVIIATPVVERESVLIEVPVSMMIDVKPVEVVSLVETSSGDTASVEPISAPIELIPAIIPQVPDISSDLDNHPSIPQVLDTEPNVGKEDTLKSDITVHEISLLADHETHENGQSAFNDVLETTAPIIPGNKEATPPPVPPSSPRPLSLKVTLPLLMTTSYNLQQMGPPPTGTSHKRRLETLGIFLPTLSQKSTAVSTTKPRHRFAISNKPTPNVASWQHRFPHPFHKYQGDNTVRHEGHMFGDPSAVMDCAQRSPGFRVLQKDGRVGFELAPMAALGWLKRIGGEGKERRVNFGSGPRGREGFVIGRPK